MDNLSPYELSSLRLLFGEMTDSRRNLRPILAEIVNALDKGFFVDADSEDVNNLLKKILALQEHFASVEQIKRAVNSKQLEQIDKTLETLEQNSKRDELNATLSRIETLEVDSNDPAVIEAVKRVKLQAEHIRIKSAKLDADQFAKLAERFILLAEIIDNAENFSSSDYLKISTNFQDNPLIAMVLTSKSVHFPKIKQVEEIPEDLPPVIEKVSDNSIGEPNRHRLSAVIKKVDKVQPDLSLLLATEKDFVIEKAALKKQITVKSFGNKIHDLFDAVEPLPIFKTLVKSRIFFTDDSKERLAFGKISKKIIAIVPRLFEKLFDWGIVDRITWRGRTFYFLNDFGLSMCIRAFTHSSIPTSDRPYFLQLTGTLQLSLLFILENSLKGKGNLAFYYNPNLPVARAVCNGNVILCMSLILLGEDWAADIARFKMLVETQTPFAICIVTFTKNDSLWVKVFDTTKFKKIKLFLFTWDGLFDQNLNDADFKDFFKVEAKQLAFDDAPAENPVDAAENISDDVEKVEPAPQIYNTDKFFAKSKNSESAENFLDEIKKNLQSPTAAEPIKNSFETENVAEVEEIPAVEENPVEVEAIPPVEEIPAEGEETPTVEEISAEVEEVPTVKEIPAVEFDKTSSGDIVKADIISGATLLFKAGETARGMLALHALRDYFSAEDDGEIWADYLTKEVGFILDDPITKTALANFDTFTFWTSGAEIPKANIANTFDYLNLAATIKNFFAPADPTSYKIQKLWKQINDDKSNTALKACPAAKTLISLFNSFTEKSRRVFADSLDAAADNTEDNFKSALAQILNAENVADSVLHSDVNHRRVKDVIQQLFKNNGLARKYLYVENFSDDELLNFCQSFSEMNLRELLKDNSAVIKEEIFSEKKIGDFLDEIWEKPVVTLVRREHEHFIGPKRKKVTGVMTQILTAILNYIQAKNKFQTADTGFTVGAPIDKAMEILEDLQKQITRAEKRGNLGVYVFRIFVENLTACLEGKAVTFNYNECLLGANYIELENNLPVFESFGVEEFSLQKRFFDFEDDIKNKSFDENLKTAYDTAIKNYDCGILQNLKVFLAALHISEGEINHKINGIEKQAARQIEKIYSEFLNDIELARNYSRITDQEKIDGYINAAAAAKNHFSTTKNVGLFQRFVNACNVSINAASLPQKNALLKRLDKLENFNPNVLQQIKHQIEMMNLTVAEDYMNRLETDGDSQLTALDVSDSDLSTLDEFISEYETLLRTIFNANGSVELAFKQRIHSRLNRETQNALDFVRAWKEINSGQNPAIQNAIISILQHLSFGEAKIAAQNFNEINQKSYTVTFTPPQKVLDSYAHPFAIFGTEIYKQGLEIIYLSANRTSDNISQVLSNMTTSRGTIVLFNNAMTLPNRRSLAKSMKTNPNLKNIIVIDKVLALYLTRFDDAQRGKKMLQAALPFARVQPYTQGGVIAPEMFIGRSEELDQIRDMNGPVFVYGGRQLGKSALLRQVKALENNPAQKNFAFFIDLKNLDAVQTLKKIVYELQNVKLLGEVDSWNNFSLEMHKLFDGQIEGVEPPAKILLLLDESDTFLSSKDSELAIDTLRELLIAFSGRFKFVLAGLHKVIRFEQNSGFGNLNHISVLPFKPADAMELLLKPMSYLGFRVSDDSLLSAIFSRTNYYPGSIQYYCKMLVDAVSSNYAKQNFDVVKNPPYTLDDDYLKNMLGNREFQEEINQKFQITLHLDDDDYYEIIALAVAWIYYEHNRPVGVDVTEIKNICIMCGVEKITRLSDVELLSLLDEMVALNILRRIDGKFEFNRYAFWHMMGTESEVNEKLDSYGLKA